MKKFLLYLFVLLSMAYSANSFSINTEKQNFSSQDIHHVKDIHSLDLSPSSNFIIYLSTKTNQKKIIMSQLCGYMIEKKIKLKRF